MMIELGEKNTFSDQVFTTFNDLPKTIRIHSLLYISMVHFLLSFNMLRKKAFLYAKDMPHNMLRICLHIEKGPLAASCSKPLLFMSMEANVAVWRLLMSSLAKNI